MNKPALLIYRDGRILPDGRVYPELPWIVISELWPGVRPITNNPYRLDPNILERHFIRIGNAGPYTVYAEEWSK